MMDFSLFPIILVVALVIFVLVIFFAGFVSASPGEIKVISGPRGQRVIQGKTGWKMPILERVDTMTAGMIQWMPKQLILYQPTTTSMSR